MLKICKNMARTEHKWESTKRRLTFWHIFLEILPYKSFTKFGVCSKEDEKKKQFFWQYFVIFHEIKSKFMHRKRSFWKVLHVRQLLPTILTLTSWTALVHICTTLSDFVRKELSPKSDEDQFSPHNVNTFSKEMVMRFIKWSPQGKYFDLLSNSLN